MIVNSFFPLIFDLLPTFLIVISITRGLFKSIRQKKRESKLLLHKVAESTNEAIPIDQEDETDEYSFQQD